MVSLLQVLVHALSPRLKLRSSIEQKCWKWKSIQFRGRVHQCSDTLPFLLRKSDKELGSRFQRMSDCIVIYLRNFSLVNKNKISILHMKKFTFIHYVLETDLTFQYPLIITICYCSYRCCYVVELGMTFFDLLFCCLR